MDNAVPFSVPVTNYRFKLAQGVEISSVAKRLEGAFLDHGKNVEAGQEELDKATEAGRTPLGGFSSGSWPWDFWWESPR